MCIIPAWAQHSVKGVVKDSKEQSVTGASIVIRSKNDSLYYKGGTTDGEGQFAIEGLKSGVKLKMQNKDKDSGILNRN